jgi:hypothetical protein
MGLSSVSPSIDVVAAMSCPAEKGMLRKNNTRQKAAAALEKRKRGIISFPVIRRSPKTPKSRLATEAKAEFTKGK